MRIATMDPEDLGRALDWAADEGWNPGLDDAAAFRAADPGGFLVGREGDTPVACVSVVRHAPDHAFLGLYICRPEWRGRGHGWALWQAGLALAGDRTIGLDGVPAQQANYARSGFVAAGRTVRHVGRVAGRPPAAAVPATAAMLPDLVALDAAAGGVARPAYLGPWFTDTATRRTLVLPRDGRPVAVGTVRRCRAGLKVGPLLAADAGDAATLLDALAAVWPGEPLAIDVPESNRAATDLATGLGLVPAFETARMYRGPAPEGRPGLVFAVTTLELG